MTRILVVDDEPMCTLFLSMALEAEGFAVRTATNADEALSVIADFTPDFLITDWMLKDSRDGIELASLVRQAVPQVRIIFITGMAQDILEARASGLSYDAIIVKPIELDTVLSLVQQQVR